MTAKRWKHEFYCFYCRHICFRLDRNNMHLPCTHCLIMMSITAILTLGDMTQNVNEQADPDKLNMLDTSFHHSQSKCETGQSHLPRKSKRSRRSTSDGTQIPGNICSGCSASYTPYFSGQCFLCPPGTPGPRGPPGQQVIPGRDGRDGRDAMNDPTDVGVMDSPDYQEDSTKRSNDTGGVVYVRWGRNECPLKSELIYVGIAGGTHYSHKGSGTNYLCMPEEPIYDEPVAGASGQNRGYVNRAEYETNTFAKWNRLHNSNVYCSVCLAPNRPTLVMIPARNICPGPHWTKEYSGYLVSAHYNHEGRTEYVCMDRNPEAIPRSVHNADGVLFYPVEGRCGSSGSGLPCFPYVDGYELTCVVCTI